MTSSAGTCACQVRVLIDFDRSEKDHSSRFRFFRVFPQPVSKPAVISALASSLLYLGHPTFEMRGGTSGSCRHEGEGVPTIQVLRLRVNGRSPYCRGASVRIGCGTATMGS